MTHMHCCWAALLGGVGAFALAALALWLFDRFYWRPRVLGRLRRPPEGPGGG